MHVRHQKQVLFVLVFALWLFISPAGHGQSLEELLSRRVRDVHVEAINTLVALSNIAEDYEVPIGVEAASQGQEREIKIEIPEGTLRDVLDAITKQDPRYEWTLVDGVINFTPRSSRDELSAAVLSTNLKEFQVRDGATLTDIKREIIDRPEVSAKLNSARVVTRISGFTGGDFHKMEPEFILRLENATVRQVLNQLIRTSAVKYWVVNRFGDNREIFLLNF